MTIELRKMIYELLKADVLPKVRYNNELLSILSTIWDVYQKKSTGDDPRYKVLGDEIEKHYVMNDDWGEDKLFLGILKLLDVEEDFIRFTERITLLFENDNGFSNYEFQLSIILNEEGLKLYRDQNEQGYVFYKIGDKEVIPQLPQGSLKFYVCKSNVYNTVNFYENEIVWPEDKKCFALTYDYGWNDYSYKTRYRLYIVKEGKATEIGELKIMKRGVTNTSEVLPAQFVALDGNFCSLGSSPEYYQKMRALLGNEAYTVLGQLRDAAFYESVYKSFENDDIFRISLVRDNSAEKARQEGRYYVTGRNMEDAYSFSYRYELPYPGEDVLIDFNYKYGGQDYERIIGLIGENGVGKTTLIKRILKSLVANDNANFVGLRPLFSSVLMISYSPFDHYQIDTEGQPYFINYEYSGLMKGEEQMFTTKEQVDILINNIHAIYKRKLNYYTRWKALVGRVISLRLLAPILTEGDEDVDIDSEKLLKLCESTSSGETMFLYSISAIMAKIRSDSLIIMDEPEQHLHPSAVTALMHSVYKILELYNSYALISTHSPYIIRELVSPNVYIFKRFENGLCVKRIGIESFGEDVSVLSDIIFDNMSEEKKYEKFIEEVVKGNNYDYNASVNALQTGPNALSLNAKLLIRTVINKRKHEAS